jgi:hypothetical protein
MKSVYVIPAATRIAISKDGSDFNVSTLKAQLQFDAPVEVTDAHATFADGPWRIRVDRGDVILSEYDGTGGVNQFGI